MTQTRRFRLQLMMFLQYIVPGSTVPILSLYFKDYLHFTPVQIGWILAMPAIAGSIAPFVVSHMADRMIRSERLLGLCHILAAVVMFAIASRTTFWPVLLLYFAYGWLFMPTFGITNTVALHHVEDAKRDFGGIRMWGTAGWVFIAWVFSFVWLRGSGQDRLPDALYMSAIASITIAAYSLTLPRWKGPVQQATGVINWNALKAFARPSLIWLCVLTFINSVAHQSYYYGMSPYLSQCGFEHRYIMPAMSLGQFSEVIVLGLLGVCLARLGIKKAMIIGTLAQTLRYLLFAFFDTSTPLIILGIGLHGFCYAFFFTAGYLYVDSHSTRETRAGVQQLFTLIISGLGVLGGSLLGGYVGQLVKDTQTGLIDFRTFWLAFASIGLCVASAMALFFKEEEPIHEAE